MHFIVQKLFDLRLLATSKSILTMDPKNPTLNNGATTMERNHHVMRMRYPNNNIFFSYRPSCNHLSITSGEHNITSLYLRMCQIKEIINLIVNNFMESCPYYNLFVFQNTGLNNYY